MLDSFFINLQILLLFSVILYKAKFHFKNHNIAAMSKNDTNVMRGMAAVFVMLSHYDNYIIQGNLAFLGPAQIFLYSGGLGVCVFFFLSGYGLWLSYADKPLTVRFLASRFLRTVPAFIILRFLTGLPEFSFNGLSDLQYIVLYILNIVRPSWFITEILIVYVLFFISCKLSPTKKMAIPYMTYFLCFMSLLLFLFHFNERWYNANLLFSVGMLFAKYWDKIMHYYSKFYAKIFLLSSGIFVASSLIFILFKGNYVISPVFKIIAGIAFCTILVGINMILDWDSRLFSLIGSMSLYLYILHMNIWNNFTGALQSFPVSLRFLASCLLSFLISYLCYWIEIKIRRRKKGGKVS